MKAILATLLIFASLSSTMLGQQSGQPRGHPLIVNNGTSDKSHYESGEMAQISATSPDSDMFFLRWKVVEYLYERRFGDVFARNTTVEFGDARAEITAVFASLKVSFAADDDVTRTGVFLPLDPASSLQTRLPMRVILKIDTGHSAVPASEIMDHLHFSMSYSPTSDLEGVWSTGEGLVDFYDAETGGNKVLWGSVGNLDRDLFTQRPDGSYEATIWYEGKWTEDDVAQKFPNGDAQPPKLDIKVDLSYGEKTKTPYFKKFSGMAGGTLVPVTDSESGGGLGSGDGSGSNDGEDPVNPDDEDGDGIPGWFETHLTNTSDNLVNRYRPSFTPAIPSDYAPTPYRVIHFEGRDDLIVNDEADFHRIQITDSLYAIAYIERHFEIFFLGGSREVPGIISAHYNGNMLTSDGELIVLPSEIPENFEVALDEALNSKTKLEVPDFTDRFDELIPFDEIAANVINNYAEDGKSVSVFRDDTIFETDYVTLEGQGLLALGQQLARVPYRVVVVNQSTGNSTTHQKSASATVYFSKELSSGGSVEEISSEEFQLLRNHSSYALQSHPQDALRQLHYSAGQLPLARGYHLMDFEYLPKENEGDFAELTIDSYHGHELDPSLGLLFAGIHSSGLVVANVRRQSEGQEGIAFLLPVELKVDYDRDGGDDILSDAGDKIPPSECYHFWVNDDNDVGDGPEARDEQTTSEPRSPKFPDNSDGSIDSLRDLEDFTRLHLDLSAMQELIKESKLEVGVRVRGDASIRLYYAADNIKGSEMFLFGQNEAEAQKQMDPVETISNGSDWLPIDVSQHINSDGHLYLIFEGVTEGKGEITVAIRSANGATTEIAMVPIRISRVTDFYEHWTAGDWASDLGDRVQAKLAIDRIYKAAKKSEDSGTFDPEGPEEDDVIVLVHGWRVRPEDRRTEFGDTAFKRLWHSGFRGRFYNFTWPTGYTNRADLPGDDWDFPLDFDNYADSEQIAYHVGSGPLKGFLDDLNEAFPGRVRVMAHSMGGVVTSEALRSGAIVHTYAACQTSMVGHAYDRSLPTREGAFETPERYAEYPPESVPYHVNHVGRVFNFYNENDYALRAWRTGQSWKPNSSESYSYGRRTDRRYANDSSKYFLFSQEVLEFPRDTYEIFAHCAEGQSLALGATSIDTNRADFDLMRDFSPGNNFTGEPYDHSGQFRGTLAIRYEFWWELMTTAFSISPSKSKP